MMNGQEQDQPGQHLGRRSEVPVGLRRDLDAGLLQLVEERLPGLGRDRRRVVGCRWSGSRWRVPLVSMVTVFTLWPETSFRNWE